MISVITCPRPTGVKYLYPLLDAVNEACPNEKRFLFCDGNSETWPGWQTVALDLSGEKVGVNDNKFIGWRAIEHAQSLGEDLLFLEDDAEPVDATSVVDALNHVVPDECAFTAFHRSRWTEPGIHAGVKFMMSQAVKIPLRSSDHLLAWHRRAVGDWEAIKGVDTAIAVASHSAGWVYEQTERNYFRHVGEVSAVQNDSNGRSVSL